MKNQALNIHVENKPISNFKITLNAMPLNVLKLGDKIEIKLKKPRDLHTTSISVLEWPMLQTIQEFFIRSINSRVTMFLLPETVNS